MIWKSLLGVADFCGLVNWETNGITRYETRHFIYVAWVMLFLNYGFDLKWTLPRAQLLLVKNWSDVSWGEMLLAINDMSWEDVLICLAITNSTIITCPVLSQEYFLGTLINR